MTGWNRGGALAALLTAAVLAALPASASAFNPCPSDTTDPTASFTFSPATPQSGSVVSFDASGSSSGYRTDSTYNSASQTCEVTSSGPVGISSYSWNFGDGSSGSGVSPTHTYASPGTYTVTLTVNAPGAGTDTDTHDVVTAWNVTLTAPAAPTFWTQSHKRQTITLSATAAGPQPVQRVEFYVRGVKVAEDTSAPYSVSFDTTTISDGDADIYARAVGTGGNAGSSATRTVVIDNTAPAFTLLSGPTHPVRPGQDTFTVRFTDDQWLYGNAYCWADSVDPIGGDYCVGAGVEKKFEAPHTFNLAADGPHTVYFRAADAAGNLGTGTASVTIDGTPPVTSIDSGPADGSSSTDGSPSFALGADEASTYACRLYSTAGSAPAFGACSGAASHGATGLAPGTYRFEAVATDVAGNEDASPAGRTFTVAAPVTDTGGSTGQQQQQQQGQTDRGTVQGGTPTQQNTQGGPQGGKAGKCAALKGKKRAACIRKKCGKLDKKKTRKRYRQCVKSVTRKR